MEISFLASIAYRLAGKDKEEVKRVIRNINKCGKLDNLLFI
jgi:hypothetical protein